MLTPEIIAELECAKNAAAETTPEHCIVGFNVDRWGCEYRDKLCLYADLLLSAARRAELYERALMDIRIGKRHEDNLHPLGEFASQAFRYHKIAADAMGGGGGQ